MKCFCLVWKSYHPVYIAHLSGGDVEELTSALIHKWRKYGIALGIAPKNSAQLHNCTWTWSNAQLHIWVLENLHHWRYGRADAQSPLLALFPPRISSPHSWSHRHLHHHYHRHHHHQFHTFVIPIVITFYSPHLLFEVCISDLVVQILCILVSIKQIGFVMRF